MADKNYLRIEENKMTASPLIIALAIATLSGIVIMVLDFIIPDTELSKGIIVGKHTDDEQEINHVQIIGDVPVCYAETIPTKYYLDIRGYDQNNKMQTITIDVSEETYNQYAVGDTWDSSTHKE
jgi:hypothetical protein